MVDHGAGVPSQGRCPGRRDLRIDARTGAGYRLRRVRQRRLARRAGLARDGRRLRGVRHPEGPWTRFRTGRRGRVRSRGCGVVHTRWSVRSDNPVLRSVARGHAAKGPGEGGSDPGPRGLLLFAGHDRSEPPMHWNDEDRSTLTTPDQVASELPGLVVRRATVVSYEPGAHTASPHHGSAPHHASEGQSGLDGATTLVLAVRPD